MDIDQNSLQFKMLKVRLAMIEALRTEIKIKKEKCFEGGYLIAIIPNMFGDTMYKNFKSMPTFTDCKFELVNQDNTKFLREKLNVDSVYRFSIDDVDFYMDLDTSKNPSDYELMGMNPFITGLDEKMKDMVHIRFIAMKGE